MDGRSAKRGLLLLLWDRSRSVSAVSAVAAAVDGNLEGEKTTDLLPNHIPTTEFGSERFLRLQPHSRKVVQEGILVGWANEGREGGRAARKGNHKLGNKMQILTRFSPLLLLAPEHGPHRGQQEVFRLPVDRLLEGAKAVQGTVHARRSHEETHGGETSQMHRK